MSTHGGPGLGYIKPRAGGQHVVGRLVDSCTDMHVHTARDDEGCMCMTCTMPHAAQSGAHNCVCLGAHDTVQLPTWAANLGFVLPSGNT